MQFRRNRSQVIYRYVPGALFDHDAFGICRVTDLITTAPGPLNEGALKNAFKTFLNRWRGFGAESYPSLDDEWYEYKVGVPDRVVFEPFPPIVECVQCRHITSLDKLAGFKSSDHLCIRCHKGSYRQLGYVVIHNCGKVEPIPLPKCPHHGDEELRFQDTGRFVTSEWVCGKGDYRRGMPRYRCQCAFSRISSDSNASNDKYVRINDSSLMYSHTVNFVNLPEKLIKSLNNDPSPTGLILARLWGLIEEDVFSVAESRREAGSKTTKDDTARALVEKLIKSSPDSLEAKQLAALYASEGALPADEHLQAVNDLAPAVGPLPPSQTLLEFISLRDAKEIEVTTPDKATASLKQRGDKLGTEDFERGVSYAQEELGFDWIGCISNFPLAMATLGYSRVSSTPGEAFINPFRTDRVDSDKTPIYVVTADTEAIMVQLSPLRVSEWLLANNFVQANRPVTKLESWAWLRRNLQALSTFRGLLDAPEQLNSAEAATLTLLHTISHLLMRQIEWSGFDAESVGEYLLPEALSIIIHSNNYTSFTIGGMVTMYEQRLHGWLKDTFNAAFNCVYNPICEDEGASCVGCLHRQHNCEGFNSYLSRAVLEGGRALDPKLNIVQGFWMSSSL